MEIHIWKGKGGGITVELTEAQEAAVYIKHKQPPFLLLKPHKLV